MIQLHHLTHSLLVVSWDIISWSGVSKNIYICVWQVYSNAADVCIDRDSVLAALCYNAHHIVVCTWRSPAVWTKGMTLTIAASLSHSASCAIRLDEERGASRSDWSRFEKECNQCCPPVYNAVYCLWGSVQVIESCTIVSPAYHNYRRQRSVAKPYVIRSMVGYHSNSWASCLTQQRLISYSKLGRIVKKWTYWVWELYYSLDAHPVAHITS